MKRFFLIIAVLSTCLLCAQKADADEYSREPKMATTINFMPTEYSLESELTWVDDFVYIHRISLSHGDSVMLIELWSVADDVTAGEYEIVSLNGSWYGVPETVMGSAGYDEAYEEDRATYLKAGKEVYYLVSGKVTISSSEKGMKIAVEATSAHGSTITAEYESNLSRYSTNDEPEKQDTIRIAADTATYELKDGGYYIYLLQGEEYAVALDFVSSELKMPGEYMINDSRAENTVVASRGSDGENDEPSFVLHDVDGNITPYYLVSGRVLIEPQTGNLPDSEAKYKIHVEAVSAHGTVIEIDYHGTLNELVRSEWSYDYEPAKSDEPVVVKADEAYYWTIDNGVQLSLRQGDLYTATIEFITSAEVLPEGEFEISHSLQNGTVKASNGGAGAYDDASYLWVNNEETGYYLYSYFLQSGKVIVKATEQGYTIEVDALSYNGTEIKMSYSGAVKNYFEPDYTYDSESKEAANIVITADDFYLEYDDGYVIAVLRNDEYVAKIGVVAEGMDLPTGELTVSDTEAPNTIVASKGGDDVIDNYSFLWQLNDSGYVKATWYIVGGTMSVSEQGKDYAIKLNATSYYGSTITINYNIADGLQMVDASDLVRVDNGRLIINSQAGETVAVYSVTGQTLYRCTADGETVMNIVEPQVVLVRVGNRVSKVVI